LYLIEWVLEYGYYPDGMVAAVHEIHQHAPKTLVVYLTSSMKSRFAHSMSSGWCFLNHSSFIAGLITVTVTSVMCKVQY
jgi:hypothetical protein